MSFSNLKKKNTSVHLAKILFFFLILVLPITAHADVSIQKGPTPIKSGDAVSRNDITLKNDRIAVSFAVQTPAPWGVAKGGILDGAVVKNGETGVDRITLADFIPNNWSSWPTTYQQVTIIKDSPEKGIVRTKRDWEKCELETTYYLEKNSDRIKLVTKIKNTGKTETGEILSGYVLWATGGYQFGPPGLGGVKKTKADKAYADWTVTYDSDWMTALHAPYYDFINYHGRDMYLQNNLKPGEERIYEGYLQITPSGDLAPVLEYEIERKNLERGKIYGTIRTVEDKIIEKPFIIVEKNGQPYTWAQGQNSKFEIILPEGEYEIYATAEGFSSSPKAKIKIEKNSETKKDFTSLKAPGNLELKITDSKKPCDARIEISKGQSPLIGFLGKKTFFTELDRRGIANLRLAPGHYEFNIESGADFFSRPVKLTAEIKADKTVAKNITVNKSMKQPINWYNADLHHHSDQLDGTTPPEFLVRSQLAANVDFAFSSDHDTIINNKKIANLTSEAGIKYIPSVEISPSWGHFNVFPIPLDTEWDLDSGTASAEEIFSYAKEKGAKIIQQNHPFIPYGYFANIKNNTITGKFRGSFDLVELNSDAEYEDAWKLACAYWNKNDRYYLGAGTDVHNVWNRKSGEIRMFAYSPDSTGTDSFINALKNGNAYASFGPMIEPLNFMFGNEKCLSEDENQEFSFIVKSVNGLKNARVLQGGKEVKRFEFKNNPESKKVNISLNPDSDTWFALIVEDSKGKKAYTNPVWLNIVENPEVE
jgi:hypothetical protein